MPASPPATKARVRVRRVRNEILLPRDHPDPERLRARLESAKQVVEAALARTLAPALAGARPGFWLVRRLHVACDSGVAWESETLGRAWASAFSRTLSAALVPRASDEVLWFRDRAAYTATFLTDLARGRAWGHWAYERFAGLRPLSTSAALRTALAEADDPWAVVAACDVAGWAVVVGCLSTGDGRRVLAALGMAGEGAGDAWGPLPGALAAEMQGSGGSCGEAHLALRLCARAATLGVTGASLVTAAVAVARLVRVVAEAPGRAGRVLAAVEVADLTALAEAAGAGTEQLLPLLAAERATREALVGALSPMARVSRSVPANDGPVVRHTPCGGMFLLLPLLDELPLEEATAGWPDCEGTAPAAALRLLMLAQALGAGRASFSTNDPVVRDLAGVGPRCGPGALAAWSRAIGPGALRAFSTRLAGCYRQAGAIGLEDLVLARAPRGTGHRLVLLDGRRGQWLALGVLGRRRGRRTAAWLARTLRAHDVTSPRLFLDEGLEAGAPEAPPPALAEVVARLSRLADDLEHLQLPHGWGLAPAFAAVATVASQALLRALAWRLPGFAHASLGYLCSNFLDARATLEDEPDRRVVHLSCPPLHLVLAMTGLARASYRLRWTDGRPFALFPAP